MNKHEIKNIPLKNQLQFMDTYPEWSPDGKYLYFYRFSKVGENFNYKDVRYNLYRVAFNPENRAFRPYQKLVSRAEILMEYFTLTNVMVPVVVPFITTFTPVSASPDNASVTATVTLICCWEPTPPETGELSQTPKKIQTRSS